MFRNFLTFSRRILLLPQRCLWVPRNWLHKISFVLLYWTVVIVCLFESEVDMLLERVIFVP